MRNLKKVLSLVLALMMVLSVMVTANAAFTDAESIQYTEAVDVLAAAGIINGVENADGTYSYLPTDTLNREAAAAIVSRLVLGGDVPAAVVDALNNPFADVNGWSTNVIKYCYAEGIVDGVNATTFLPKDALTGYAFAKMLLVAAGIPGEYTGSNWKINVYTAAKNANLLVGLENVVLSGNLTREQAAQMAFNAALAGGETVITGYGVKDTPLSFPTYFEAYVAGGSKPENVVTYTQTTGDLMSEVLKLESVPYTTDAGLTGHVWVNAKGEPVTPVYVDDTYVASFAAGTSYAALLADLGYNEYSTKTAGWYANGTLKNSYDAVTLKSLLNAKTSVIPAPVDVYVDAAGNYKLMATIEYLASVTAIADKANEKTGLYDYTFTVEAVGGNYNVVVPAAKDAYAKNAYYLVVPKGDNSAAAKFLSIETIAPVTVTVTAKGTNYVRVGTEKYTVAVGLDAATVLSGFKVNDKINLFLASDGSVISVKPYLEAGPVYTENLVFMVGYWSEKVEGTPAVTDKWGNVITPAVPETTNWFAQVVDMDGEEVAYPIAAKDAVAANTGKLWDVQYDSATKVYGLKAPTTAITTTALAANKISFKAGENTYYYNTAEYVSIIGSQASLKVSTGSLAGAVANGSAWIIFSGEKTNKTVSKVIYWADKAPVVGPTYDYAIFVAADSVATEESSVSYTDALGNPVVESVWTHTVMINGKATPIVYNAATIKAGFYEYYEGAYGYYVLKELAGTYDVIDNVYGNYVTIDGLWADKDVTGIEIVDLTKEPDNALNIGDKVAFYQVPNANGTYTVTLIYILP